MSDIQITCGDCNSEFEWTDGEQVFMERLKEEGKVQEISQPKRCPDCRRKRKQNNTDNS